MKVVMSNNSRLLPLVPEGTKERTKDNSVQLEFMTDPTVTAPAVSPKYKIMVLILSGDEDIRTIIEWTRDYEKVLTGMAITGAAQQSQMAESLLKDTALMLYKNEISKRQETRRETAALAAESAAGGTRADGDAVRAEPLIQHTHTDDVHNSIKDMVKQIMPRRILTRVKRYLRRECRKPADMKVKTYYQYLLRINREEIPRLPPFQTTNRLTEDEMMDIILFGTPKGWQKEMDRQNFDPITHCVQEVVDFMENIESAEDYDPVRIQDQSKDKSKGKPKQAKTTGSGNQTFCHYHGKCSHSSNNCEVLKKLAQAKKDKDKKEPYHMHQGAGGWKNTSNKKPYPGKQDLAAFIKKEVNKGVQQGLAKKRKADDLDLAAIENELEWDKLDFGSPKEDDDTKSEPEEGAVEEDVEAMIDC